MDLQPKDMRSRGKGQNQPNWNIKIEFPKFRIFIKSTVILEVRMSFENENIYFEKIF